MREVNRLARQRDPKRDEAMKLFLEHNGDITNRNIAEQLGIDEKKVAVWKGRDKWLEKINDKNRCTTKKRNTTKKKSMKQDARSKKRKQIIDALVEAGTYSPALDLLIEIYLDAFEEYQAQKAIGENTEKLRKELAKYLGQLGLDGKNKELIKKSGVLLEKGEAEKEKESEPVPENNKLIQFRQRRMRG